MYGSRIFIWYALGYLYRQFWVNAAFLADFSFIQTLHWHFPVLPAKIRGV
jgi:hypothetical protein